MRVSEHSESELRRRLQAGGVGLDLGLVRVRVRGDSHPLASPLRTLYRDFPLLETDGFFDVTARISARSGLRRVLRPQAIFELDGEAPFEPFPAALDLPLLEWGLNWAIAMRVRWALLLHGGALERNGVGLVLPAIPGSGKSTLTAALASRGYRLLSDEFGAVRLTDGMLMPILKPIALKNESIEVIRRFAPDMVLGPVFRGTRKGDVAHAAPDAVSVERRRTPASPKLVVFPQFRRDADLALEPFPKARAFTKLAVNCFNYAELGPAGFDAVSRLVADCDCYRLVFGRLEDAVPAIDDLIATIAAKSAADAVRGATRVVESAHAVRVDDGPASP